MGYYFVFVFSLSSKEGQIVGTIMDALQTLSFRVKLVWKDRLKNVEAIHYMRLALMHRMNNISTKFDKQLPYRQAHGKSTHIP